MSFRNRVLLVGNLGQNPELHVSENGTKVLKVSIATNDSYKNNKGEKVTSTEWHNVVVFGNRAEVVAKYCKKGSLVGVEGSLKSRKYTTSEGVDKYVTEIMANDIIFLDSSN
jgi:single-strand DNA-binding protein